MLTFGKSITVSTQRCHPIETTLHTIPLLRKFALKLRLFNLRHLSEIVACSESLQEIFALELNMNISVVQNGVNTDFFKPTTINNKISLRNELKLPVQKKIYLVLGNICKRKNIGLIIKSFNNIRNCNAILLIVGNGDETEQMKALSADNQSIIFVGKTDTPLKFLQASDYLVSAALAEGLPNTVLEALSCGLPCILSDINPHKELIQDSNVGLLFNVHSQTQLEKAIETSFNWDMSLMSENARSLAENKFSIDVLAHNYYKIYKSLCTQS
jgi:glycosyltransferase involved in cell wall biosynthesis